MTGPARDPGLYPDLAYWLEMSEALAWRDTYTAAAAVRGNPIGAASVPVGGGVAFGLTVIDVEFFNRVIGLGVTRPALEADADAASRFFLDLGVTQSAVQIAPGAQPADLVPWLNARGYVQGARWVKLWRDLDQLPEQATSLHVEQIDASRAEAFGDVCLTAFEMPAQVRDFATTTIGRPGWTHYLGLDGDPPVSTAAMFVTKDVAWLGYGATLEAHRGRGWQSAMFAQRLRDARDLGCRLAVTETGEETEDEPVNHSYRNMLRMGFSLAYARQNWVRRPAPAR
jgi:GNAT superfamily N-acetyltransferase